MNTFINNISVIIIIIEKNQFNIQKKVWIFRYVKKKKYKIKNICIYLVYLYVM